MFFTIDYISVILHLLIFYQEAGGIPTWTTEPSNPSLALEGDNITLHWIYDLEGWTIDLASFRDKREGHPGKYIGHKERSNDPYVTPGYHARFRVTVSYSEASMTILGVQRSDTGLYRYEVRDNSPTSGYIFSDVTILVQYVPQKTNLSSNATDGKVCLDAVVQFTCVSDASPPVHSYLLYKDNVVVGNSSSGVWNISMAPGGNSSYKCQAKNTVGSGVSESISVLANVPPTIAPLLNHLVQIEGYSVNLYCYVSGSTEPTVTWTNVSSGERRDEKTWTITNINRADAGEYRCDASNECGNHTRSTFITVLYPASISRTSYNQTKNEGDAVTLNCTADGNPAPNITWTRSSHIGSADGNPISNITKIKGSRNSSASFPLNITGKQDEGYYRCTADNGVGTPASKDVHITVENFHPFNTKFTTSLPNYIAELNNTFNITCSAEANPPTKYRFYREQELVFDDTSGIGVYTAHVSDRVPQVVYRCIPHNSYGDGPVNKTTVTVYYKPEKVTLTSNATVNSTCGDLWVTFNCTSSDANPAVHNYLLYEDKNQINNISKHGNWTRKLYKKGNRSYHCQANHTLGNETSNDNINLNINVRPSVVAMANRTVTEGDNMTLYCNVSGSPEPSVVWTKVGSGIVYAGKSFILHDINRTAAGEYTCQASNECNNASESFFLAVEYKPENVKLVTNISRNKVCLGDVANFTCTAEANPSVNSYLLYENQRDAGESNSGTWHKELSTGGHFNYSCVARNPVGTRESTYVTLSVNVAPSIEPFVRKPVTEGDNGTLFCNAYGSPEPFVNWTHVKSGRIEGGKTWNFRNINRADAGEYKCEAANECGNDIRSVNVTVHYPPKITEPQTLRLRVKPGTSITIPCRASGNPEPIMSWFNAKSRTAVGSGGILSFNPATESDSGFIYTCTAENGIEPAASFNITLIVGDPPNITEPQTGTLRVRAGSTINIPCRASGSPEPNITWINTATGAVVGSDGLLSFNPATERDSGFTYICKANNGIEPAASSNISLIVGDNSTTITIQLSEESYLPAYNNLSSRESKELIKRIMEWLDNVSEITNTIKTIEVTKLSEGSVIASLKLNFNQIVHIGSVISAIRDAAENGSIGSVKVNATSIRVVQEPVPTIAPTSYSLPCTPTQSTTPGTGVGLEGIIGITLGVLAVLVITVAIVVWCVYKKRKNRRTGNKNHHGRNGKKWVSKERYKGDGHERDTPMVTFGHAEPRPEQTPGIMANDPSSTKRASERMHAKTLLQLSNTAEV